MKFEDKRNKLLAWLQTAAELELSTIPPYLIALLSIKPSTNRGAAENIRSVMMEEMLHLALVANVISSIGGSLCLTKEHAPSYPLTLNFEGNTFKDRKFSVDLAPFSAAAIETFMKIEQPSALLFPEPSEKRIEIDVPGLTIGEFYQGIIHLLEELDADPSGSLFVGDPLQQIGVDYYWSAGGKPVVVSNLASAKEALNIVIHQGEGASFSLNDGDETFFGQLFEVAHYYRFCEIHFGRRYLPTDKITEQPNGELFPIDYNSVYPIKVNTKSSDYGVGTTLANINDTFNQQYSLMLLQLEEALNGNPKMLYTATMSGMHNIADLALQMMKTPIEGDPLGYHGSPSFEWVNP